MLADEFGRADFLSFMMARHVRSLRRGTNENAAMNGVLGLAPAACPAPLRLTESSASVRFR